MIQPPGLFTVFQIKRVVDFEKEKRTPIDNNVAAIRRALEAVGIEFIPAKNGKGAGVRLREG